MDLDQAGLTEWELVRLNNEFAYHLDRADFKAMVSLFTADCRLDRGGQVHQGQDEVMKAMLERPKGTTRHLLSNFHFANITEDSAEGTVSAMVYNGPPQEDGQPVVYTAANGRLLEFTDSYVRTPDGWRIQSRKATPVFVPQS